MVDERLEAPSDEDDEEKLVTRAEVRLARAQAALVGGKKYSLLC